MKATVNDLPPDLTAKIQGHDLIVFDGACVLCTGFFRFVLKHDTKQTFKFATAQSPLGQEMYRALGLDTRDFESNLVVRNGLVHTELDTFAVVMGALEWPWKMFQTAGWVPAFIGGPVYRLIARNRYRWFGKYDTCVLPDTTIRDRFLEGGL